MYDYMESFGFNVSLDMKNYSKENLRFPTTTFMH